MYYNYTVMYCINFVVKVEFQHVTIVFIVLLVNATEVQSC